MAPTYSPRELLIRLVLHCSAPEFQHSLKKDPLKTLSTSLLMMQIRTYGADDLKSGDISAFTPFQTRPRRRLEFDSGYSADMYEGFIKDGTHAMVFVLWSPDISQMDLIVGATAARFNRFKELHQLARELRDVRMEPMKAPTKRFHEKLQAY